MATLTLFSIFEIILLTDTEMKQILTKYYTLCNGKQKAITKIQTTKDIFAYQTKFLNFTPAKIAHNTIH
jgi:hypothetical protein